MKKKIVLISLIMLLCLSAIGLSSCKNDNDENGKIPVIQREDKYVTEKADYISNFAVSYYSDMGSARTNKIEDFKTYDEIIGGQGAVYISVTFTVDKQALESGVNSFTVKFGCIENSGVKIIQANSSKTSDNDLTASFKADKKPKNCNVVFSIDDVAFLSEVKFSFSSDGGEFKECYSVSALQFTKTDGGYEVKRNSEYTLGSVYIPSHYSGEEVVSVGNYGFCYCSEMKTVTIPSTVKSIGEEAFFSCEKLEKINYSGSVDEWVQIGFADGYSNPLNYANELYINGELVSQANITTAPEISDYAFYNYKNLTSVTIGDSVKKIGEKSFFGCNSIISATVPCFATVDIPKDELQTATVTSGDVLPDYAFKYASKLQTLTLSNTVKKIGEEAFFSCENLEKINYSGSVDEWVQINFADGYSNPLNYANGLYINGELVLQANITTAPEISDYAFYKYKNLTSITIGDSVTSIGEKAFYECPIEKATMPCLAIDYIPKSNLKTVILTSGETLGEGAFSYCSGLTDITIPNSVTSIASWAFNTCLELTSINYNGTKAEWQAISKDSNWKYSVPSSCVVYCSDGEIKI